MAKKMQSPRRGNHKCLDCPRDSATEAICSLTALFTMAKQGNTFLVLTGIVRIRLITVQENATLSPYSQ